MAISFQDGDRLFDNDLNALAGFGNGVGVIGRLETTASSPPDMNVHVAAGAWCINRNRKYKGTVTDIAIDPSHPVLNRLDIIIAKADGSITKVTGSPAAVPYPPDVPADSVLLSMISVPAGLTAITPGHIIDKRIMLDFYLDIQNPTNITISYNPDGTINAITDNIYNTTTTFSYDGAKKVTSIAEFRGDVLKTFTYTFTYDASGRVTNIALSIS